MHTTLSSRSTAARRAAAVLTGLLGLGSTVGIAAADDTPVLAPVRFHIVDQAGAPVAGACVTVDSGDAIFPLQCDGDGEPADGHVTITVAGPWDYAAVVYDVPDGYLLPADQPLHHEPTGSDVTFVLHRVDGPANRTPSAADDRSTTTEDVSVVIPVLANDTDLDNDLLRVHDITVPQHGDAVVDGDAIRYTPSADWSGTDTFTYAVADGHGAAARASVTVEVAPTNDAPGPRPDWVTTAFEQPITIDVLANDVDAEDQELAAELISQPAHGTATLLSDGRIQYRPAAGYSGTDTFTYRATDGIATSGPTTVQVEVQPLDSDVFRCTIQGSRSGDTIIGTPGDDVICASGGNDLVLGLGGNDVIFGDAGNDIVFGGSGDDRIDGGSGTDVASGDSGRDGARDVALSFGMEYAWPMPR